MFASHPHAPGTLARKFGACLLPLGLGVGSALVLLLAAGAPARPAFASNLIFPGPCGASIQACINSASAGDTILIQAGNYTESLTLSKAVSLTGALSSTTILHALPNTRVLTVTGAAVNSSVVISGLTFTGGDLLDTTGCPAGCGGGMLITDTAQPLLTNLRLMSNTAGFAGGGVYAPGATQVNGSLFANNTASFYYGGGLYVDSGLVTVTNSSFVSNSSNYYGGGLFTGGTVTVMGTSFISNSSGFYGGGLYVALGAATVSNSRFLGNSAYSSSGGGLYVNSGAVTVTNSSFISNTSGSYGGALATTDIATVSGTQFVGNGYGGSGALLANGATITGSSFVNNLGPGVYEYNYAQSVTVSGTQFIGNTDGGVQASSAVTVTNSSFVNNISFAGGGLYASGTVHVTNSSFVGNYAAFGSVGGGGLFADGGGTVSGTRFIQNSSGIDGGGISARGRLSVTNSTFVSNTAAWAGGGLVDYGAATVMDSSFTGNTSGNPGGGLYAASATVSGTSFLRNSTSLIGGGLYAAGDITITSSSFVSNSAGEFGGGLSIGCLECGLHADGRIVNTLFAQNQAGNVGDAINEGSTGSVDLLHDTLANPGRSPGTAVVVVTGTVGITDTIIAGYSTGLSQTAGTLIEDYNLFYDNGTDLTGTLSSGAHDVSGNPRFVDPLAGDYHLSAGSAAIDAGTDAGVTTDFEGQIRPGGAGFDIGYDELNLVDLAVTQFASATLASPSQRLTYTLVFSNAGPNIAAGVRLTDIVPANLTALTYTSSGAALTPVGGPAFAWQVASLAPGAGGVITVTGVLSAGLHGSVFTNTAVITTANIDTNPANNASGVSVTLANVAPLAAGDTYTLPPNATLTATAPGLLANDTDANHDPLSAILATSPVTGTLVLAPSGAFTYTPPLNFSGPVTFTYRASDGLLFSPAATVTITVNAFKLYLPLLSR